MGKSAKLHKRVKKTKSSANQPAGGSSVQQNAQVAKKKVALKDKAAKPKAKQRQQPAGKKRDGPILGGADYVALMMGGRRKAKQEAAKLPPPDDVQMS